MVDVLLATFNSERFLAEQIDSIIRQDFTHWRLLIRDGGSVDKTLDIIGGYVEKYPQEIRFLPSDGSSTACENFAALLQVSEAPYVMFSDHDDVWLEDKISSALDRLRKHEQDAGTESPALVFSDMNVVDKELKPINESFFRYQRLDPSRRGLNYLLVQNVGSSCTIILNRALVDLCRKIPKEAVMHDHWVMLVAAAFGTIHFLAKPALLYRQHGRNLFGASKYGVGYFLTGLSRGIGVIRKRFRQNIDQAGAFRKAYDKELSDDEKEMLDAFASLESRSWFGRRLVLLRYRIFKTGARRNIGMFLVT